MDDIFESLNEQQLQAVRTNNRHVLILAGAGSGKTRVITSRIIYLIHEKGVNPRNILAVTFTNKACMEMKERVNNYLQTNLNIMVRTFHSFGAYVLRMDSYAAKRNSNFQIYDSSDSKSVIKKLVKNHHLSKSETGEIYRWIQSYKQAIEDDTKVLGAEGLYKQIYQEYNDFLVKSNCFDFEDLIFEPVKIFTKYPQILDRYRSRFKYILVDEYQDTNHSQFELLKLLAGDDNHLMVVGDEDQSIYKFRGANIYNILNFQDDFKDAEIIRLERNYRSTQNILDSANTLIMNNSLRIGKNLYTDNEQGSKITLVRAVNEHAEVEKIFNIIQTKNFEFNDTAVLFRTNNQSRPFEQYFNKYSIPYTLIGTIRFFEREEIKDAICILKWLINPKDRIAFSRFVNKPTRGIGEKTLERFFIESTRYDDLYQTLQDIDSLKQVRGKRGFREIRDVFADRDTLIKQENLDALTSKLLNDLKIIEYYEHKDELERTEKVKNLHEFIKILESKGRGEEAILTFLEEVTLSSSIGNNESIGRIKLMTVHNAKGLEFDNVFVAGMEHELFPHINSIEDDEDMEEERRLFYVAVTRARKHLTISFAESRNIFGWRKMQSASQFLKEIPDDYFDYSWNNSGYINKETNTGCAFSEGDIIRHRDYGKGKIVRINSMRGKHLAKIDFWDYSFMDMILEYTKLEKVED